MVILLALAVLKDIHQRCLCHSGNHIVYHRAAHHLVDILDGIVQRTGLHQIVDVGTLLLLGLLVDGDELQLALVPAVGHLFVREEDLAIGGNLDILHGKLSADV